MHSFDDTRAVTSWLFMSFHGVLLLFSMSNLAMTRSINFLLRNKIIYRLSSLKRREDKLLKILHDFTDGVILKRRIGHGGGGKEMAFLDVLLQSTIDGKPLTNMDIREEVDTFMFEGHDTTSSGIAFCLYNLAKHPDVQQKAFDEIKSVIGDDENKPVTLTNLNDLKYLEMVIKETLRLYPSIPAYGRKMVENVEISKG
jgi:cytochrome P450 family 4